MSTMIAQRKAELTEAPQQSSKSALVKEFALGDWRVLPQLNRIQLRDSGQERQLEPRLIKLLCFLAANEDRVLSREELVQELWPRVIVNENSLTRAVSELRKQLRIKGSSVTHYIETIPKRGYRLIPDVVVLEEDAELAIATKNSAPSSLFSFPALNYATAASAACLCLLIASYISLDSGIFTNKNSARTDDAILLSDEILNTTPDYLGGEVQLSTLKSDSSIVESIATPVVSLDEKQYAFIQYQGNGSTIFLGGLGTAIEPVPVYFSNQHLFNLAWSPVGNSLLFAMKPSVTTAAVYSSVSETAELVKLNLNTLETSRLVEELNPAKENSPAGLNLT
jgi:DNA-binding winged helix-turn-helix (wHTH) protein